MIRFGTAGIPLAAKGKGIVEGVKAVRKLGLEALELEFVHSVNISEEKAPEVKKAAKDNDAAITCHGQYYINLNAQDKEKLEASKQRLFKAARIAEMCGGVSVTFHPGYYMKKDAEDAYRQVKKALAEVVEKLKHAGSRITVRPETTGKHKQFGNLAEVIRLSQEIEGVQPCIDYAHMRARAGVNDYKGFAAVLEEIEKELGKEALKDMHIQFSGVKFSDKGELSHLTLAESDVKYNEIAESWKDFKVAGIAISESPNTEEDALLLKRAYNG